MNSVIDALIRAVRQLGDPAVIRVAAKSIGITLLLFVLLGFSIYRVLIWIGTEWSWSTGGIVEAIAAVVLALLALWLLFRVVAVAVLQFFADEIVAAVEMRHYPDFAQQGTRLPFHRDLSNSLRGIGRAFVFNLLAFPLAFVLAFTAIGPAIVFVLINAILLGRELTDMAWLRHCGSDPKETPVNGFERFVLGGSIAALMLVPFAGLLAPIVGAAAGTHVTHGAMDRLVRQGEAHA